MPADPSRPSPARAHSETAFEDSIVSSLTSSGWWLGEQAAYVPSLGLDTTQLFAFIAATQSESFSTLVSYASGDESYAREQFASFLAREIDARGILDVLRHGVKDRGVRIDLAYFRPANTIADDALLNYQANRLSVTRQLRFSTATPNDSVDLALFINGLPVATAELKNPLTRQTVDDAKAQYRARDAKEPLFSRRALVHFAVDPDLVFLTTKLAGNSTRFLPFNQGTSGPGASGGAGNPPVAEGTTGYRTSYLWEQVWQRDSWLDLFKRYLHVVKPDTKKSNNRRTSVHDQPLIFPRYHQWDAVRKLTADASCNGSGDNYLVMHSAGSGKSNTIAWLAHRLSTLHGSTEPGALNAEAVDTGRIEPDKPVFHKTVVITDRTVLDKQLQDTIYQFDHTLGVVKKITGSDGSKSKEVAEALADNASKIIIVTAQTFPYILEGVSSLKDKRVAVIIDEAHSGQSGDTVTALKKVLRGLGAEDTPDDLDPLTSSALARGKHPNLSFFAFTATPKQKTLELFGVKDSHDEYRPFHVYSMHQAIEEGFILDVLKNYTTYQTYWKVAKEGAEDIEANPDQAGKQIARFVYLNPATLDAHAEIILDHFQRNVSRRMGGRAKAMVVTRSREAAVRMYHALRRATSDLEYDPGLLVAFSGSLKVDGVEVTEPQLNGISERDLPDAFAHTRADNPGTNRKEYRILVVAEKYQTGFDQPLLTSMYVEKPLSGVAAVQTLSRLNRTHPLKSQDDLFVLDFANEAEDIQEYFRPYFGAAVVEASDPNLLYTLQRAVMDHQLLIEQEMQQFAEALLAAQPVRDEATTSKQDARRWVREHASLYALTDPAKARYEELHEADRDAAEQFRADLSDFIRKYGFLSQVMQFTDPELERLYLYGKHLLNRLPRSSDPTVDIGEVDLTHLRVQSTGKHDVSLTPEGEQLLPGFDPSGAGASEPPEEMTLADIIAAFNDRYGLGLGEADRLAIAERFVALEEHPKAIQAAIAARNEAEFDIPAKEIFDDVMIERKDKAVKLTRDYFMDPDLQARLSAEAKRLAFRNIRRRNGIDNAA